MLLWILLTGDLLINGDLMVRYSGESVTWTACADPVEPGIVAQFRVYNLETDQLVADAVVPLNVDRFHYSMTVPRVGLYGAEVRSCNSETDESLCSDFVNSEAFAGSGPTCAGQSHFIYAILAPAGAPQLEN